jgi:hypothetical protein
MQPFLRSGEGAHQDAILKIPANIKIPWAGGQRPTR